MTLIWARSQPKLKKHKINVKMQMALNLKKKKSIRRSKNTRAPILWWIHCCPDSAPTLQSLKCAFPNMWSSISSWLIQDGSSQNLVYEAQMELHLYIIYSSGLGVKHLKFPLSYIFAIKFRYSLKLRLRHSICEQCCFPLILLPLVAMGDWLWFVITLFDTFKEHTVLTLQ